MIMLRPNDGLQERSVYRPTMPRKSLTRHDGIHKITGKTRRLTATLPFALSCCISRVRYGD
jgi:hypothetical protein